MKRIAIVDTSTNLVVQEWMGGEEQTLPTRPGRKQVRLANSSPSVRVHTWVSGTTFVAPLPNPSPPVPSDRALLEAIAVATGAVVPP